MLYEVNQLRGQSNNGKKIKEHKGLKIEICFRVFICISLMFFSIYFTPNWIANNLSPDGILEQITVFKINYTRLAFSILGIIGLFFGAIYIIKPNFFYLLQLKVLNKQNATLFLKLLLFADVTFIVVHFISFYTPYLNHEIFTLFEDRAIPEIYQYMKWSWITILLIYVSKKRRSFGYAAWALFFAYLLLDDAMLIHERVGIYFKNNFDFTPPLGLRIADIGELAITVTVGMILLFLIALAYLKGKQVFRKVSHVMLILFLALIFFGVGVDMATIAIYGEVEVGGFQSVLGVIEEGGEMFVASLILWYVLLQSTREQDTSSYI